LPADAESLVKHLLLSFPADPRLHWQLAELLNARGDAQGAKIIFDMLVGPLRFAPPEVMERRRQLIEHLQPKPEVELTTWERFYAWVKTFQWWHWLFVGVGGLLCLYLCWSQGSRIWGGLRRLSRGRAKSTQT
jgi:hypothetical protein